MGTIIHHAIVVTGGKEMLIEAAMTAQNMGFTVLGPGPSLINGYCSMLICPDGSKECWRTFVCSSKRRMNMKYKLIAICLLFFVILS